MIYKNQTSVEAQRHDGDAVSIYEMVRQRLRDDVAQLLRTEWAEIMRDLGEQVFLYRQYVAGEHQAKLDGNMRKLLRVTNDNELFTANYCDLVIRTMADRLKVVSIDGDTPEANEWSADVRAFNRFDALQLDLYDAVLTDGDAFVLVEWDKELMRVRMSLEDAWDGDAGMFVVYGRRNREIEVAVKVWYEGDARYVNLIYADRVEKYRVEGGQMAMREDVEETKWLPGVVPVAHFRHNPARRAAFGYSEIKDVIGLQDAMNRLHYSLVMTAELTAFQIRVAKGFEPPPTISPGMWITMQMECETPDDAAFLGAMDAYALDQGEIMPFVESVGHIIQQISTRTRTPIPGTMGGDSQSGEALKQREVGLIAKVENAQTRLGNAWEDVMRIAQGVQNAYGNTKVPDSAGWSAIWADAEIRNQQDTLNFAMLLKDWGYEREALRQLADVGGFDEAKIERLQQERREDSGLAIQQLALPGFAEFDAAV